MNPSTPLPTAPPTQTKIFFTSRTHSQLSQVLSELRKTSFASTTRAVALGSRKTLCVNESVRKGGDTGLDERCLDLQSGGKGKSCSFLPGREEGGMEGERGRGFTDKVLVRSLFPFLLMVVRNCFLIYAFIITQATVQDIEDLVVLGKESHVCPYYGTRAAIPQADVSFLPSSSSYDHSLNVNPFRLLPFPTTWSFNAPLATHFQSLSKIKSSWSTRRIT